MRRVRTPTVIQMEVVECGAASLAIILEHYGKWVPLDELRIACNVSRDGCNAADIVRAARTYGLEAKGYRYDLQNVQKMSLPFIVFWEFGHFLVIEGFGRDCVYVNDPARGPYTLTMREFSDGFTGLALGFQPGPEFQATGKRPGVLREVASRLSEARDGLAMLLLVSLLLIVPGLLVPTFSKIFIDDILIQGTQDLLRPLLLAMIVTLLVFAAMAWLQEWCLLRIESKLSLTGSAVFIAHLLRLPTRFFAQRHAGDLVARYLSNDMVAQSIGGEVGRNFVGLLSIAFFAAVMLSYDFVLTVIAIGINAAALLGVVATRHTLRTTSVKLEAENGMLAGIGVSGIRSMDTVKASGGEPQVFRRWSGIHARTIDTEQRLGRLSNLVAIMPGLAVTLTTAIILGVGSFRIVDGALTVGGLVAFLALTTAFAGPFQGLVRFVIDLESVNAALRRVNDVVKHQAAEEYSRPPATALADRGKLTGRIEFRNVSFGFLRDSPPLIKNLSFTIEPGSTVALVGASGSGKSTIGNLLAGLYEPDEGEILLDGVPLHEISHSLRHSSVGWVAQDIFLFEGSIYDNLTLWDSTIHLETVIRAAKDAEVHETIARRAGGYESQVLEGGRDFSGGEAQRLEIARTLALEPSVLILDEATSALDAIVEAAIDRNLRKRGCSCLKIAHRLSTIREADEILVLRDGEVVERGNHSDLMSARGQYRDLIDF